MFSYIMVFGLSYSFIQYFFNYPFRDFIKGSFSFLLCSSYYVRTSSLSLYTGVKDTLKTFDDFKNKQKNV